MKIKKINTLSFLFFSVFVASIAAGINVVALPAILIKNNVDPFLIGSATTVEFLANIVASFILSRIIARLTIVNTAILIGIIYAINIALMFFYQNFALWLVFCVINGICWFSGYVIRQSWINNAVNNKERSVALAAITTLFCFGFAAGSLIVKNFGANNYTTLLLSSSLIIASTLLLFAIKKTQPKKIDGERIGFYELFQTCPKPTVTRLLLDLQMGCLIFLSVVFGTKIGFSAENSGLLIGAFMISGFFDLYAGFLVKKYDRHKMILAGFIGCFTIFTLAIFCYKNYFALLAIYFFFGCSMALAFIASITEINESFTKEKLVAANSTFQSISAIGTLLGSFIGGALIKFFGIAGFFITIIGANILYFLYLYYDKNKTRR